MPFNEETASRIRNIFHKKNVEFSEKKMFSGVCFMVDDKMCCGTHIDKKTKQDFLLCRIGEDAYPKAMKKAGVIPMEFTGRSMKGYVFVTEKAIKSDKNLEYWIQLCLDFNPLAKSSKK